jgi:hypothetical protein
LVVAGPVRADDSYVELTAEHQPPRHVGVVDGGHL